MMDENRQVYVHLMGRLVDLLGSESVSVHVNDWDTSGDDLWRLLLQQVGLEPNLVSGGIALSCNGVVRPMNLQIEPNARLEFFPIVSGG